ncbi:hypothetical protein ACNKHX_05005 [Shigella flexneri]
MNRIPRCSIHYKGLEVTLIFYAVIAYWHRHYLLWTAALRQFEMLGSYPLNESVAIALARAIAFDATVARQGIDLPVTGIAICRMIPAI